MTDNRLVITQTQIEIIVDGQQDEHRHTQPERQTPIAPQEGVVLHILRPKELIGMQGIHLNSQHLQCQTLALVGFAINLHRHRGQIVESIVERGHRIDHRS